MRLEHVTAGLERQSPSGQRDVVCRLVARSPSPQLFAAHARSQVRGRVCDIGSSNVPSRRNDVEGDQPKGLIYQE